MNPMAARKKFVITPMLKHYLYTILDWKINIVLLSSLEDNSYRIYFVYKFKKFLIN